MRERRNERQMTGKGERWQMWRRREKTREMEEERDNCDMVLNRTEAGMES